MQTLNPAKRSNKLRRAFALLMWLMAADVLLSLVIWRAAGASIRDGGIAAACAPDARTAIVVYYSDDPALRQERLGRAAALARACPSAPVFLVGGARPHRSYFGSEEMARELGAMGLDRRRLRTGRASYDTQTNVTEMKAMAAADSANRLVLVSDAMHLLRIHAVFGDPPPGMELFDFPAGGSAGVTRIVSRVNYEAAAWLAMLAPEALRRLVFELIGRRGSGLV
jgi:uncharacterized SAM-binding protein YcdF (DUF218 family)